MTFDEWAIKHPGAAADLLYMMADAAPLPSDVKQDSREDGAQQRARMMAGERGWVLWRNNVGATPHEQHVTCPRCRFAFVEKLRPLRYGLCNDSDRINQKFKSSDLIGIKPVRIEQHHVGTVIGQFIAVEVKAPGVPITLKDAQQQGQAAFGALVERFGGSFEFSHGGLKP